MTVSTLELDFIYQPPFNENLVLGHGRVALSRRNPELSIEALLGPGSVVEESAWFRVAVREILQ